MLLLMKLCIVDAQIIQDTERFKMDFVGGVFVLAPHILISSKLTKFLGLERTLNGVL
jgi:hypothetical protein